MFSAGKEDAMSNAGKFFLIDSLIWVFDAGAPLADVKRRVVN